jgi:hypothetical protein
MRPGQRPQPTFHAIAHNGATDFLGDRVASANFGIAIVALVHQQDEARHDNTPGLVGGQKIAPQPDRLRRHRSSSGRKLLAALGAAVADHVAATWRRHAGAKAMAASANELGRLIGTLHCNIPVGATGTRPDRKFKSRRLRADGA